MAANEWQQCLATKTRSLYDTNWNLLQNHTIFWHEEYITFPRILDIPTPYVKGGGFFGPEDPRVILEHDVEDAEPIIIFNMVNDPQTTRRSMFLHYPFSNFTTSLYIEGRTQGLVEMIWSPFFVPAKIDLTLVSPKTKTNTNTETHAQTGTDTDWPSYPEAAEG
ncbi:Beta-mannosyltransferase 1 [Elasticomyces elasticus]|nr:Beta-mannosyltransferase 1 [Elasticomyces elasticus]